MRKLLFASILLVSVAFRPDTNKLNEIVDDWHKAAAEANFKNYFGAVTEGFVFLGTAPGERWTKSEFEVFSKPYWV